MHEPIEAAWAACKPAADFASLRIVRTRSDDVTVRKGVVEPPRFGDDLGGMVTVIDGGGLGYAATADLSPSGIATKPFSCRTRFSANIPSAEPPSALPMSRAVIGPSIHP